MQLQIRLQLLLFLTFVTLNSVQRQKTKKQPTKFINQTTVVDLESVKLYTTIRFSVQQYYFNVLSWRFNTMYLITERTPVLNLNKK